jgi:ACS family pantothenate transporter-like MFS transporter
MNGGPYIVGIWLTLIIWQQTDAPVFKKGYITASGLSFLAIISVF